LLLASRGAAVLVNHVDLAKAEGVAAEIRKAGGRADANCSSAADAAGAKRDVRAP
jgi:hypothetical protein